MAVKMAALPMMEGTSGAMMAAPMPRPHMAPTKLPPMRRTLARAMRLPSPDAPMILPSTKPPMEMMATSPSHGRKTTPCLTPQNVT